MKLTHNLRIIPRIILVFLIVASFDLALNKGENKSDKVLGLSTEQAALNDLTIDRQAVEQEINRTQAVLTARPDYVAAWVRLSILYEQIGESNLAVQARERARILNADF